MGCSRPVPEAGYDLNYASAISPKAGYVLFKSMGIDSKNAARSDFACKAERSSVEERIKLAEDLWDSIAADQQAPRLTTEQKSELDRRLDVYELDKNRGRLATDAVAEIHHRL